MASAAGPFHREYASRLPLPLAQLYGRAYNAKDARSRHDNSFYLFEAMVKLAAAPLVACYLSEVQAGAPRAAGLDRLLSHLALPSLGHWVGILRQMARHFGTGARAAAHPLGHFWEQLSASRQDMPCLLALFRRIKNETDAEPGDDESCSILMTLEALVRYRDQVFGNGGERFASFYESDMGPLLFPAADELLGEGVMDLLGPRGSRLVCLTELCAVGDQQVEVRMRDLVGVNAEPAEALLVDRDECEGLAPNVVAAMWPGRKLPLRLDPLLVHREGELGEEVLFLNRGPHARQVEYLSYTTGRTERNADTAPAIAALLTRIAGSPVDEGKLAAMAEQTVSVSTAIEGQIPATPVAARLLGDFELVAEIGRGGMGVVYLARQLSLGRLVALKMLPADLAGDEMALLRFRREMRVLARCDHRNIVKVLSSGTMPDGRLFYAMEYVPGCDLEQVWRELTKEQNPPGGGVTKLRDTVFARAVITASRKKRERTGDNRSDPAAALGAAGGDVAPLPLPPLPEMPSAEGDPGGYVRRVVLLMRDAALGLQAVHEQDVVHRDIKPANLMLTADGSRIVLMDFGLAKGQRLERSVTDAGGFMGTLRYVAPEQLATTSQVVGPAADVRALGVVLWELLTRRRLFAEAADEFLLASVIHERDVPRLRSIDPSFDADLESIVARATDRQVSDRIATAGKFAEYLQLWLSGEPLPIRPLSMARRSVRWLRRRRAPLLWAGAAIAILLGVILIYTSKLHRAREEAQTVKTQAGDSELQKILSLARQQTNADAGSIFLRQGNTLVFSAVQNDTLSHRDGPAALAKMFTPFALPIDQNSIAGYVVSTGQIVNIDDVNALKPQSPFHHNPAIDQKLNYKTVSILAAPLKTSDGTIIGVLQLINCRDANGTVIPFGRDCEGIVRRLMEQNLPAGAFPDAGGVQK